MARFVSLSAFLSTIVFSFSIAANVPAQDGSVLLPAQKNGGKSLNVSKQAELSRSREWQEFTRRNGSWRALWNEATGSPHRAYGNAIPIPGFSNISQGNVEAAAMTFLRAHGSMLKINPDELRLVRTTEANGRWYVTYRQVKDGIDILFSETELRIFSNGNVMAFGADFFPDVTVSTTPAITYDAAKLSATSDLGSSVTEISGNETLYILPVVDGDMVTHHLVYEVFLSASEPVGNYIALVDAHDATLLWRHNKVRYTDVSGRVTGDVQLVLPTDPFVEEGFAYQYVTIGGVQVQTDSLGNYVRDITSSSALTTSLYGPYVNVNRSDAADAFLSATVDPGDTLNILWNAGNSHDAERDGFFHVNVIHEFITTLDSNFTNINYSMACVVNINSTCNAFWNGSGVNFFIAGNGCPNTAQMPDVVYHEYGHGINDLLYQEEGSPSGMINGATHEGMADVAASVILDDSRIGRGFFGPGTILRNLDNSATYPQNVSGDPHITGLIIGGAFWDLREATDLETFQHLTHFAKYGLPDDFDDGTAFSEWFIETLVADDDDGNLGNGTPHSAEIVASFDAHGIGSERFFRDSFSHTPIPNTTDTTNSYTALFILEGVPLGGGEPDSVQLIYSADNFQTATSVLATMTGLNTYEADIPPQSWGTLVKYYITAYDPLASSWYTFPLGAPSDSVYRFLVGGQAAETGIMYAASTTSPYGGLYALNTQTAEATLLGPLGVHEIQSLTVRPSTGELYGTVSGPTTSSLYRVSPLFGDALFETSVSVANLRAVSFGFGDTLYGVTSVGGVYRINIETGAGTFLGNTPGNLYWGLATSPLTGQLWGSVRFSDRIHRINRANGSATLVGETGFDVQTSSLAFDEQGTLYGITATNEFISIDQTTAVGSLIGTPVVDGIIALAMRTDSLILSAEEPEATGIPETFGLIQNFPNPFNPKTEIGFRIPESGFVSLRVYDLLGREVATLIEGMQEAGYREVEWDASDVASDIYFYKLEAFATSGSRYSSVKKMLLLR